MTHFAFKVGNGSAHLPSRHHGHGRYYALAVLLWLLASVTVFVLVLRAGIDHEESEFQEYAASIQTHLRDRLRTNEAVLYGFAGFLGAIGDSINKNAQHSAKIYAKSILERYPHIHMLEIVRKLARDDVEPYTAHLRRTTLPDFRIRQFDYNGDRQWQKPLEKDFYYPIIFIAPDRPEAANIYGLDIDSLDGLKNALMRSERNAAPVSSEPFRLVEGDLAYVMFRPIISSFAAENQRQKVPSDISYALLVVRTQDLLPSQDSLSTAVRHHALRDDEAGKQSLTLFDIGGTPASKLESYLLPKLRAERSVGDVSQPLRLMLERQLRFNDMSFSAFSLAGMASLLSCAMLLGFLRSHERRRRAFDEGRRAIEHMALHDALTAIPNRFLMLAHLEQAISLAQRHDMKVAVLFLDLDEFKPINDLLGHSTGDLVLQEIARRLQTCIRDCDTTSRYGGDEFVILLTGISGEEDAALVASKVLEAIVQPIQTGSETVTISASIGIAIFPDHGSNAKALIGEADKAMYLAKQNGSGQFAFSGTGQEAGTANVTPDACYP